MNGQIRLVRLFGVELGLHYSWLVIAVLITFSLGDHFRTLHPDWSASVVWGSAVVTGLLFFAFIFAHELAHALVAKARGLPIRRITLFALGGMAQIEKEPTRASTEFWMGIVGPVTSFVIGLALGFYDHHQGTWTFVGASNFIEIVSGGGRALDDPLNFWFILGVTVLWTVANIALHLGGK